MSSKHVLRFGVFPLALVTACYIEAPLTTPVPAPETRIVAQVTDSGVLALSNTLGPGAVQVEGVVDGADAASWRLRMLRVEYRGGTSMTWNRELINFPRSTLANPTERRLDKGKSWLTAGIIVGTALLAAKVFSSLGGGETPQNQPPPPN